MNTDMAASVIYNIALLLALNVVFAIVPEREINNSKIRNIVFGCIIGLIGIGIMVNPFELEPGLVFDVRSILISVSGLFFGLLPTVIAAIITAAFRLAQGGIGAWTGVGVIASSAVIGLLWRRFRLNKIMQRKRYRWLELYLFGMIAHIVMLLLMLTLPMSSALAVLENGSIPILGLYPVGTVLLGILLFKQMDQRKILRKLKESEERLKVTLLSVGDGVITTNKDGVITLINQTAQEITGWASDAIGQPFNQVLYLVNESTRKEVEDPVRRVLETGNVVGLANHCVMIGKDGAEKPIADSAAPIKDDKGNILGVVFVFRDVTEERRRQEEINYLGYHDSLTGLYNRRFFDEEVARLDVERNLPISIIIGDVNGLKLTNDAFGHAAGDELLKEMAEKLKQACRKDDIVARWGGDEFIILMPKTDEKAAERICNRIRNNCAKVKMEDVHFSISLGFDTKMSHDEEISGIIKGAEDYMYKRKSTESPSMRGNTINTILLTLHEKSPREQLHSNRVSELCRDIGLAMELSKKEIIELEVVGLMHDIGKIAISDRILNKKGKLTVKEWNEIIRHPEIGYRILSASSNMAYIAEYVLKHHERPDGLGYPNAVKGEKIPIQSRILAVADAFDAMTNERTYKETLTKSEAIQVLLENSGTQFDAEIVEIFIKEVLQQNIDELDTK